MTARQSILAILAAARDDIRNQMQARGVNASGRTSASIEVVEDAAGIALVGGGKGAAPIPTLEIGRPGGRVPKGFYYIIKQWTRDKGLQFGKESERQTFSYFLAKRIAAQGTLRHKHHEDIYSTVAAKAADEIEQAIKDSVYTSVQTIKLNV